jgi:hypothetical protein
LLHLLRTLAQNVIALALHFTLQVFHQTLQFALFASARGGQLLLSLRSDLSVLNLFLDALQFLLKGFHLLLAGLVLRFQFSRSFLNLSGFENSALQIDNRHLRLRQSGTCGQRTCASEDAQPDQHFGQHLIPYSLTGMNKNSVSQLP